MRKLAGGMFYILWLHTSILSMQLTMQSDIKIASSNVRVVANHLKIQELIPESARGFKGNFNVYSENSKYDGFI
ncbi:Uncharacterised protein [Vibrio paracholerae]|nr:Uncharacterised protein [Vibrio paracholerae]